VSISPIFYAWFEIDHWLMLFGARKMGQNMQKMLAKLTPEYVKNHF
jgi:hypothetical protein